MKYKKSTHTQIFWPSDKNVPTKVKPIPTLLVLAHLKEDSDLTSAHISLTQKKAPISQFTLWCIPSLKKPKVNSLHT